MCSSSFIYLFIRERGIKVRFFEFCVLLNGWNSSHLNMIFHVQVFLVNGGVSFCADFCTDYYGGVSFCADFCTDYYGGVSFCADFCTDYYGGVSFCADFCTNK